MVNLLELSTIQIACMHAMASPPVLLFLLTRWYTPVIPATWDAKAEGSQFVTILGNQCDPISK